MRRWRRLSVAGGLGAIAVTAAALLGLASLLGTARTIVSASRQPELAQRVAAWGPVYAFGVACAPRLRPGAGLLLVDPADGVEPPYPGEPRDADWNDQDHFAYAVAPRSVTVLGRQPPGWNPAAAGRPYVAVWRQAALRSEAARASAAGAAATLAGAAGATLACRYADAAGDEGLVFAIAPEPAAANGAPPDAEPRPPTTRWDDVPRALLALACLWVIGMSLLRLLAGRGLPARTAAALALPLGGFAAAAQLLTWSEAGVAWTALTLAPPWLVTAAIALWRDRGWIAAWRPAAAAAAWRRLPAHHRLAAVALVSLVAAVAAVAPLSLPYSDGINFYASKAQDFFLEGSVVPYQLRAHELPWTAPGHPPLVPLLLVWEYLFIGHVAEHASLLLWPALLASLLGAFHGFLRERLPTGPALWCTAGLAVVASGLAVSAMTGGYSDLPLAAELLSACGLLAAWIARGGRDPRLAAAAGLFLAAGVLTKEEGLVLAGVIVGALFVTLALPLAGRRRPGATPALAALVVVAAVASLPLLWLRLRYPHPELTVSGHLALASLPWTAAITFAGLAARAAARWFSIASVVAAVPLSLGAGWRRAVAARGDRGLWFLLLAIAGAGCVYWAAMVADPLDTVSELSHTAGRLLDQVLPLPFLAGIWFVCALEDAPASPEACGRSTPR